MATIQLVKSLDNSDVGLRGEIDCKRFYLTGISIEAHCPGCGIKFLLDSNHYLSYPQMNQPNTLYLNCDHCYHSWTEEILLKVEVIIK